MHPIKRSVTIDGHRTSISLEQPFWDALSEIADERKIPLARLLSEIDKKRAENGLTSGLSTAVRIAILGHYRAQKKFSQD